MRPAPIKWPNDAKIAVSFFVAFEAFEKYSQYREGGDKPDYASLAYGEYGGKAGIWRIMDVLARNHVKGTIDTNGRIAEDFPDALKELHAGGHEIVGHGWVNDTALISLEPATGKRAHQANSRRHCLGHGQASGRLGQSRASSQRIYLRQLRRRRNILDRRLARTRYSAASPGQRQTVGHHAAARLRQRSFAHLSARKIPRGFILKASKPLLIVCMPRVRQARPSSSMPRPRAHRRQTQYHRRFRRMHPLRQRLQRCVVLPPKAKSPS